MRLRAVDRAHRTACALALAGLAALGGCQDPVETAASAPAVTPPAAPVSPSTPAIAPKQFAIDNGSIGSQVGERRPGAGVASHGVAGWLIYGPYTPMPAGRYRVVITGQALPDHAGHVHADVAYHQGSLLAAALELDPPQLSAQAVGDQLLTLPFELAEPVADLEVRIRVDEATRLAVTSYRIEPVP